MGGGGGVVANREPGTYIYIYIFIYMYHTLPWAVGCHMTKKKEDLYQRCD